MAARISRRRMVQAGTLGLTGVTLSRLLWADSARRAVSAAREMLASFGELSRSWRERYQVERNKEVDLSSRFESALFEVKHAPLHVENPPELATARDLARGDPKKVKAFLETWPEVTEVHDLHIWPLSTTEPALTAHLVMPNHDCNDAEILRISQALTSEFGISHSTLQIERGSVPCPLASEETL